MPIKPITRYESPSRRVYSTRHNNGPSKFIFKSLDANEFLHNHELGKNIKTDINISYLTKFNEYFTS